MLLVTVGVVSITAAIVVLAKPRWVGEGDWEACSRIALVPPGQAAETVARMERVNLWDFRAHVWPAFVNSTGWVSGVTCSGGLAIGPAIVGLPSPTSDRQAHFTWEVVLQEEWGLLATAPTYLDWDTSACVFRGGGC